MTLQMVFKLSKQNNNAMILSHLSIIIFFSFVSKHRPNDISRVFDDHLPSFDGFLAEQTSAMNRRPADAYSTMNRSKVIQVSLHSHTCDF